MAMTIDVLLLVVTILHLCFYIFFESQKLDKKKETTKKR